MNQDENRVWLIRHADNSYSHMLKDEELKLLFNSGEMKPQDEICHGHGYWFSLQDVNEMRKHFGNIPMEGMFKKVNDEVTMERYAVTANIVVTQSVKEALKIQSVQTAPMPSSNLNHAQSNDSIHKASPLMKVMLAILTLVVLILLFVWFG